MTITCELYGWDVSPFTEKVKAYCEFKGIEFQYKNPSIFTFYRKIKPAVGKVIMPVVFLDKDTAIQDSSVIIDYFESQFPSKPVIPNDPKRKILTMLVELFGDEWLPMASLHYRWNYAGNYDFIIREFGRNALPYLPSILQRHIAKRFGKQMAGYLPILGITESTQTALENTIESLLRLLDRHFAEHKYLFGDQPVLADFSVYGQLYAHLHRDPVPSDLIRKHTHVFRWITSIQKHDGYEHASHNYDDETLESLVPIVQLMLDNHAPLLRQTISAVHLWAADQASGTKLPQRLGDAKIVIDGIEASRFNLTYPYWMFQRIQDMYLTMSKAEQDEIKPLLQQLKVEDLFETPLEHRVELNRCRLYLM